MSQVKSEIICASCHESIIKGGYVRAGGSIYHAEHFVCHHCKQPLKNEGFVKHEDHVYCQNDYTMLFADKCEECLKPLVGSYLSHQGKFYHKDCFICNECKKPFEDLSFITIMNKNLHKNCFKCKGCEYSFNDGKFCVYKGAYYHPLCK